MKLSEVVAGYATHKQAMGMRFRTEARILRSFCRASGEVIGLLGFVAVHMGSAPGPVIIRARPGISSPSRP
jgi:hypothetical protein